MKAKLQGTILSVDREKQKVEIKFQTNKGKVATTSLNAQDCALTGTFVLAKIVADELKLGSTLTFTISDEEAPIQDLIIE